MAVTKIFGSSVKRREDPRLITGKGYYTDDMNLPGQTYMAVLPRNSKALLPSIPARTLPMAALVRCPRRGRWKWAWSAARR
jgi:hypothetical protein